MNLGNEFVKYKQALALKELGFDEPCFGFYWKTDVSLGLSLSIEDKFENDNFQFKAPTFSQAFRWFREKYGLKSWIQEHTTDTFIYEIRPHKLTDYRESEVYEYFTYAYKIYEEAELACLTKLIEIVKNK